MQESESRETCGVPLRVVASVCIVFLASQRHFQVHIPSASFLSKKTFYFASRLCLISNSKLVLFYLDVVHMSSDPPSNSQNFSNFACAPMKICVIPTPSPTKNICFLA